MFPLDPTIVIIFGTLLAALLASLVYSYWYQSMKWKTKQLSGDPSKSLKVSELETIIRDAVAEATASLNERIDGLEDETRALRVALVKGRHASLPERSDEPLLAPAPQPEQLVASPPSESEPARVKERTD